MSTSIFNIGKVNTINNNNVTINTSSATNVAEVVKAFMTDNAEDIQAEECTDAKNATVHPKQPLPFFVPEKLEELGLYTIEQFAAMYREAVEGDAHSLADFLHKYEKLGVFDFRGYEKKEIHETLRDYFPTMKEYSYTNFIYYF